MACGGTISPSSLLVVRYPRRAPSTAPPSTWRAMNARTTGYRRTAASIASFEQTYPGAQVVPAGSLGGEAACVTTTANNESAAMCVWFDNDSFGTLVSPTMSSAKLANTLDAVRPGIEQVGQ